jgi:hypothetical protein
MWLASSLRWLKSDSRRTRANGPHQRPAYRLRLEVLEARLPLGDVLLSTVVGSSLLGSALPLRAQGLWASDSLSADLFGERGQFDGGHPATSETADSRAGPDISLVPLGLNGGGAQVQADTAVNSRPALFARRDNSDLGSSTASGMDNDLASALSMEPWRERAPFWEAAALPSRQHFLRSGTEEGSFSNGGRIALETSLGAAPLAASGLGTAPLLPAAEDRHALPASTLAPVEPASGSRHKPVGSPAAGAEVKPIANPRIQAMDVGEPSLKEPLDYGAGRSPRSVATGDFRGNGILDLAVVNSGSNDLSIFLGNSDGTLRLAETVVVGTNPFYVTTGHFHDPGILDLAVADSGSNEVSILLGHGDGSFGLPHNFSVGRNPQSIAIGDFRGIGISDLAVANRNSNNVSILLGNGKGTFAPASNLAVGGAATFVVAADFARDGRQDLAVTTVDSSAISAEPCLSCSATVTGRFDRVRAWQWDALSLPWSSRTSTAMGFRIWR